MDDVLHKLNDHDGWCNLMVGMFICNYEGSGHVFLLPHIKRYFCLIFLSYIYYIHSFIRGSSLLFVFRNEKAVVEILTLPSLNSKITEYSENGIGRMDATCKFPINGSLNSI